MKYIVLSSIDVEHFVQLVNAYLSKGWQLQGGVAITADRKYFQAMILENKDEHVSQS